MDKNYGRVVRIFNRILRSAFINYFRKAEYVKSGKVFKVFASSSMIFLWLKKAQIFCQCLKNVSKHEGTHILPRFYASQDIPILSDGLAKLHQKLDK